jgi:hypothetical protein
MIHSLANLAMHLSDAAAHADYASALALVALAALGVAALSLWALTVVVRALTGRRR